MGEGGTLSCGVALALAFIGVGVDVVVEASKALPRDIGLDVAGRHLTSVSKVWMYLLKRSAHALRMATRTSLYSSKLVLMLVWVSALTVVVAWRAGNCTNVQKLCGRWLVVIVSLVVCRGVSCRVVSCATDSGVRAVSSLVVVLSCRSRDVTSRRVDWC